MARVTMVKKARKSQGACGKCGAKIKGGDGYRWWKFRFGGTYRRCMKPECAPRPSDLTQSEFYSQLYGIQESLEAALQSFTEGGEKSDLESALEQAAGELRELGEECQGKFDNMPEGLQQGDTGQLLETRASECESKADDLESAASDLDLELYDDAKKFLEDHPVDRQDGETEEAYQERVKTEMDERNQEQRNEAVANVDTDLSID